MKKITMALTIAISTLTIANSAFANNNIGFGVGYAQSKINHNLKLHGANFKVNFGFDESPLNFMFSATILENSAEEKDRIGYYSRKLENKVTQTNVLVGPSYSINEYINIYGLVGATHIRNKVDLSIKGPLVNYNSTEHKFNKTAFAYGAGLQINPIDRFYIDLGYEGTKIKLVDDGKSKQINSFILGVGYQF